MNTASSCVVCQMNFPSTNASVKPIQYVSVEICLGRTSFIATRHRNESNILDWKKLQNLQPTSYICMIEQNKTCTVFVKRPRVVFQEVVLSRTSYFDQFGVKGTTIELKKPSNTVIYIYKTIASDSYSYIGIHVHVCILVTKLQNAISKASYIPCMWMRVRIGPQYPWLIVKDARQNGRFVR